MEPQGIPVSTGYSRKDLASRAIQKHLLLRKVEIRPNDWPEIPQDSSLSLKKNSMPNPIKSLEYFSCYSLGSFIPIKSPGNSARCNWGSSAYWEDLKPYWKSEKRLHFFRWLIKKPIIYKSFKDFTNLGKKTNRTVVSCSSLSPNIFIQWPQLGPPNNQENKIPSDTY